MRRGFKAEAERLAARLRTELGATTEERLNLPILAAHVGVEIRTADQLVARTQLEKLEALQPGCFSAATFHLPDGRTVAVTNPVGTTSGRRNSDLAHELAHVLLKHEVRRIHRIGDLSFFDCDPEQEEEANWLGGCLLLPRALVLADARRGLNAEAIAAKHDVSLPMARFRLNASGVHFQVARGRR
jgi:Zn-dependent peptidase ImmA (M78 family)